MKRFFRQFYDLATSGVILSAIIFYLIAFLVLLGEFSPIITLIFVLTLTILSLKGRATGLLAIAGVVVYVISWPIYHKWGIWPGQATCAAGIILWFAAVFIRFGVYLTAPQPSRR